MVRFNDYILFYLLYKISNKRVIIFVLQFTIPSNYFTLSDPHHNYVLYLPSTLFFHLYGLDKSGSEKVVVFSQLVRVQSKNLLVECSNHRNVWK